VIGIVLNGTFYCTSAVGKRMIESKKGGVMLNVIANYAWTGAPGVVHSASAKAGVLAMTRTLAVEWARHKIRVNAIAPGWFPTELTGQLRNLEQVRWIEQRTPIGRAGLPGELDGALVFLASDASSYVVGQTLVVDGGWTVW
jgi:NAD(P)-dependent dehydrogenase (short-subunit alcohol dehydrogenase family)